MNFKTAQTFKSVTGILLILLSIYSAKGQILKSLVYDFDGLDINQTSLPEGDFKRNDLTYQIAANPLSANDMLGDRVLKLNLNWNSGNGTFGRGISRFIEFDPNQDKLNFYFYNPFSNNQNATLVILLTDDDDQSNTYNYTKDDAWEKSLTIPGASGWQFISVPLHDFIDSNTGGNGIFDIAFTQNKGMLLQVEFRFNKSTSGLSNPVFYLDMINFSEGDQPRGATIFDLPGKDPSDYCLLGAYNSESIDQVNLIPTHIESLFPTVPEKKLKYANFFMQWAMDGTTVAKALPGNAVQTLLNDGYTPIITWEPQFQGYSRLDPVQPRLNNIINGDYNSYIDAFANKIKTYSDTVIIRFMHEFEGDWYPWSIVHNNQDPARYVSAFRTVVDRFRARGVTNVQWMWCVNSDYFPYLSFNWIVPAYPGDNYVDIVATDIYNNHYPTDLPWWKSFRFKTTESYYYLTKYFPQKPLYICELGCRERKSTENTSSQSKGAWFAQMDKELQADFHKARALVFFNGGHDQNWTLNSSSNSIQSLTTNIWYDDYYFKISTTPGALMISITSPANNSSFNEGSNITVQVSVSGGSSPIQKVEFFEGVTKLGEDLTSPYSYTWNNVPAGNYALSAKATDSGNNTAVSSIINITVLPPEVSCSATGNITREVWNNISGTTVSSIPLGIAPSSTGLLSIFEPPSSVADNYGQRIRGFICPPLTGNYIFWIASDDNSELWLSTDNNPANKQKIASVSGWTSSRQWTKYSSQQSASKYLIAGQKYYIEALHKEGSQGDNCAVGWQLPTGIQERPIPGSRLSAYTIPLTTTITSPANNSSFNAGSSITIQATASSGTGTIQKVEFFEGTTKLGEDLTSPYSVTWNNVPAGNYTLSAKATDSGNNTAVSSIINIAVSSIIICSATGNITREVWNNISGTAVSSIPLSIAPSSTGLLSIFEAPSSTADNYGQRIRGFICPPLTGNYIFWIASDDNSELWLSTNDQASNKIKIASVSGYTSSRQWTKYSSQQSASRYLIAGQKYYIEALHKEGSQGDNCAVGWQLPTGVQERPIPGNRLSPFDVAPPTPTTELIAAGSSWKYLDNGTNQGSAWRAGSFNDETWKTGNAELGYGDGGEATVVSYGTSSTNKYITTYFRKTFNVTDKSSVSGLELSLIRDDGAAVYINGVEVYRNNLPSGTIYYNTLAPTYIDGSSESNFLVVNLSSSSLVNGLNVIAVEIHQNAITSSDISFNLKLKTMSGSRIMEALSTEDRLPQNTILENTYDMIVYPNPNTGHFNLELCIDDLEEKNVVIEVTNSFGKVVYKKQAQKINGCVKEAIELESSLPIGVYILKVIIDDKIQTSKILLTR